MTVDPGTTDDLPFADPDPADADASAPAQSGAPASKTPLDDDQDGILDPHEDGGQAGQEPDQGPAIGPAADADEQGGS